MVQDDGIDLFRAQIEEAVEHAINSHEIPISEVQRELRAIADELENHRDEDGDVELLRSATASD